MAWQAYRAAQKSRDDELNENMRKSWREADGQLTQWKSAPSRVESHLDGAESAEVRGARKDAAILFEELKQQRHREWAVRQEKLQQMKQRTGKRVDDRLGADVLKAKPLYAFANSDVPSNTQSARNHLRTAWRDPATQRHRSSSPKLDKKVYRTSDGEYDVNYEGTDSGMKLQTKPMYAYRDAWSADDEIVTSRGVRVPRKARRQAAWAADPARFTVKGGEFAPPKGPSARVKPQPVVQNSRVEGVSYGHGEAAAALAYGKLKPEQQRAATYDQLRRQLREDLTTEVWPPYWSQANGGPIMAAARARRGGIKWDAGL